MQSSTSNVQARLESYKAAKEAQSAEALKAALDAKMSSASVKHEEHLKTRVESAQAEIAKATSAGAAAAAAGTAGAAAAEENAGGAAATGTQ